MADGGRARVAVTDVALTAVLVLIGFLGTGQASINQHLTAPPLAYLLTTAACLSVLLWRVQPLWTFMATNTATLLYLGLGYAYGPILFATAVAVFGVASRMESGVGPRRRPYDSRGIAAFQRR